MHKSKKKPLHRKFSCPAGGWRNRAFEQFKACHLPTGHGNRQKRYGYGVARVGSASLAEKNGLSAGDVIPTINGKPVAGVAEMLNALQVVI